MNNFLNEAMLGAHLAFQYVKTCFNNFDNLPTSAQTIILIVVAIGTCPVLIFVSNLFVEYRLYTPSRMSDWTNDHKDSAQIQVGIYVKGDGEVNGKGKVY